MQKYLLQTRVSFVFLGLVLTVVFLLSPGFSPAADNGPVEQLKQSVDSILKILQSEQLKQPQNKEEREQKILAVVTDMFDFRDMARSSLGQSWNDLSSAEQDKFVGLFTKLVEQRYVGKIDSYENQKVVYGKQRVKDGRALIYTNIVDKDLEIPIVYRMEENNGRWLVNDMKIENVSLIVNYRRDFDSVIRKEQFDGLVKKIEAQIEKYETAN